MGRLGHQLRHLLGSRDQGRAVPVRQPRQARDRPRHAAGIHGRDLARLSARGAPRPALRLPRPRALRPGERPPLQPGKAADRPLRAADPWRDPLARCGLRLPHRPPARGSVAGPPRQRLRDAQMRRRGPRRHLGSGHPPEHALGRDDHLRGACERHDRPARGPARKPARQLRRPRRSTGDRPPREAGRHGGRADAVPGLLRRPLPDREGADQLLGLQHHRLLRARRRATSRPAQTCTNSR